MKKDKPLTAKQAEALATLKDGVANNTFKITEHGFTDTGINTTTLGNLRDKGFITTEAIYLGGVIKGLQIAEQ